MPLPRPAYVYHPDYYSDVGEHVLQTRKYQKTYDLEVGNRADMVILDTQSVWNAFRLRPDCLYVIKKGRITAKSQSKRQVMRSNALEPLLLEAFSPSNQQRPVTEFGVQGLFPLRCLSR